MAILCVYGHLCVCPRMVESFKFFKNILELLKKGWASIIYNCILSLKINVHGNEEMY